MTAKSRHQEKITILWDMACSQSIILREVLPFADGFSCGYSAVLQGFDMRYVPHPLHLVHLQIGLVSWVFSVEVSAALPV